MSKGHSVNHQIKERFVNLVLMDGSLKEKVPIAEALQLADDADLDLVEMSPSRDGKLSICKILDYGKMMYHQSKKSKSNKHIQKIKEIKYGLNIDPHDLDVRHNKVKEFISKHYLVRYVMELKGREKYMVEEAKSKIANNLVDFEEIATWKPPVVSGGGKRIEISTTLHAK